MTATNYIYLQCANNVLIVFSGTLNPAIWTPVHNEQFHFAANKCIISKINPRHTDNRDFAMSNFVGQNHPQVINSYPRWKILDGTSERKT